MVSKATNQPFVTFSKEIPIKDTEETCFLAVRLFALPLAIYNTLIEKLKANGDEKKTHLFVKVKNFFFVAERCKFIDKATSEEIIGTRKVMVIDSYETNKYKNKYMF